MFGYTFYISVTFIFLCLPVCWNRENVPLIDSVFMAVSVISTAGLQTVNTAETYNFFGQCVILIAVQIGGLGYMTVGSCVILASKGYLPKNRLKVGRAVLAMPEHFDPAVFFRHIVTFTFAIELAGAVILAFFFWCSGTPHPVWAGVYHSVTAFCTAGFSIFPNNLESFRSNVPICMTVAVIMLLGAIGFIVLDDVCRSVQSKTLRTTLTTRIILAATFGALFFGTLVLFFDQNMAAFPIADRLLMAFFQTVSALTTTGFNSIPLNSITVSTAVIGIVLMILGASPSGTGGGLKSTTWSAAIATVLSFLRGHDEITFFGCTVPPSRLTAAFASITLYMLTFAVGTYFLLTFEKHPAEDIVFEAASALGTVGLSRGITPELTTAGKLIIMCMMYIGRIGVLSLAVGAVALYHDIAHDEEKPDKDTPPPAKSDDIVL